MKLQREDRSARQLQILNFVHNYLAVEGIPPTLGDIGQAISLSKSVVHKEMQIMEGLGLIRRRPNKMRAITLTLLGRNAVIQGRVPYVA